MDTTPTVHNHRRPRQAVGFLPGAEIWHCCVTLFRTPFRQKWIWTSVDPSERPPSYSVGDESKFGSCQTALSNFYQTETRTSLRIYSRDMVHSESVLCHCFRCFRCFLVLTPFCNEVFDRTLETDTNRTIVSTAPAAQAKALRSHR